MVTGRLAAIHFAATEGARNNLLIEHVAPESIHVTGNSGIDALLQIRDRLASGELAAEGLWQENPSLSRLGSDGGKRLIVVTAHRRESFGGALENICRALRTIARRADVEIVYPVHRNPNVLGPVQHFLDGVRNVHLIEPLDYVPFVDLMRRACLLLTDSGGIQEEGPSLGKPVLVLRDRTERPEAVAAGTVRMTGTKEDRIVAEVTRLLDDADARDSMSRVHNPYGDGRASPRIAAATLNFSSSSRRAANCRPD